MLAWGMPVIEPPRAAGFLDPSRALPRARSSARCGQERLVKMSGAAEFVFGDEGIVSVRHIFDFSQALVSAGVLEIKPTTQRNLGRSGFDRRRPG